MPKRSLSMLLILALFGFIMLFISFYMPSRATEEYKCQTFPETAKMICGRFLSFWQQNGGLRIFGYPISNPFVEKNALDGKQYTVQYFERALFELHPENRPPNDILLAHLGAMRFQNNYAQAEKQPGEPYIENVPVYPGAKAITVIRSGDEKLVTRFEVNDRAEAVWEFYRVYLTKNGWEVLNEKPGFVSFRYQDDPTNSLFLLGVEISPLARNTVRVEVTLFRVPARDVPLAPTPTSLTSISIGETQAHSDNINGSFFGVTLKK
jgi:hypothetical protein